MTDENLILFFLTVSSFKNILNFLFHSSRSLFKFHQVIDFQQNKRQRKFRSEMSGNNDVGDFKLIAILDDVGEKLAPQYETVIEIVTEISKLSQKTSQTSVTNIDVVEKLNENVPIRQIKYKL